MKLTDLSLPLLLFFAFSALAQENAPCYFPNGDPAQNFKPCSVNPSDTGVRPCCAQDEVCLSNGLCFGPTIGCPYRGGCTDQSFLDSNCPRYFLTEHPDGWANLINSPQKPIWQVDTGSCTDKDVYTWTAAQFLGISFTTALSSSPTGAANSSSPATVTVTVTATGSFSAMAAETSLACSSDIDNSRMKVGLAVRLGLGIPLLGLAAAFAALWLREIPRNGANSYAQTAKSEPTKYESRDLHEADSAETQELDAGQGVGNGAYR